MDNFSLTQRIKRLSVCLAGLIFAVFLGIQIGTENYGQLLLGAVIVGVGSVALLSGRFFWVLTIASSFLGGTFPILGGQFTPFQILMAIGVAKFLIGDLVLKRTRMSFGNPIDTLLIAGFMAVLTWHGIHDRFGMRFLGSNIWGGRNYVNVYVGLAAYCVVQSIPMVPKVWAKLPYIILAVSGFDLTISIITTIFPSSIFIIYPFYSAVSNLGIIDILGAQLDVTGRIGAFGNFGFLLIVLVLSSVSLQRILNPSNLFRWLMVVAGAIGVLFSGFRSVVFNTVLAGLMAGIRDLKWAVLAILPLIAVLLFTLSVINSQFFALPKQVQRSLAFIPGKWDPEMASDAASSNDFRQSVWTLWRREYFPAHPWLGRGFGFKSDWSRVSPEDLSRYGTQQMVETGNIHNGFFASLDAFGILGTLFFVIWNIRLFVRTFQVPPPRDDADGRALRFLALYLAVSITSYWIGAQDVGSFLPKEFALAAVLFRLQREIVSRSASASVPKPRSEMHRTRLATA